MRQIQPKKIDCPECGRLLRTKKFIYNKIKKIKVCVMCNKKLGSNIFYTPKIKGEQKKSISPLRYDITKDEKGALFRDLTSRGMSSEAARARISNRGRYIWWFQKMKWRRAQDAKGIEAKNKINMKKFIEGLKR